MARGWHGKILHVDLSDERISVEDTDEALYRTWLGGAGLSAYLLLRELEPGVDPLGPDNVLVVACSVLNGYTAPGLTRYTVAAKSPLTGAYGEAEAGGWWAPEFKRSGFDAVVVKGRAKRPVFLWVHDGQAELRDAGQIWGRDIADAERAIRQELGRPRARCLTIGPGGENLVRYACVINERKHANGRTGIGAVFGSKQLKAIVAGGGARLVEADAPAAARIKREVLSEHEWAPGDIHDLGTSGGLPELNDDGILPTRNFHEGSFDHAYDISGEHMRDTILVDRGTCFACPVACKREVDVASGDGRFAEPEYGGPEYETIGAFGSLCGVGDITSIATANDLCNRAGLDTISAGASIAFAMDCAEAGLLSPRDTDGIDLRFGQADAMLQMLRQIIARQGFGDVLADGVKRAAARIGHGAEDLAMHVKGQEFPMHEPRGKSSLSIGYAISPTGADHIEAAHDPAWESDHAPAIEALRDYGVDTPVGRRELNPAKVRNFFISQSVWGFNNSVGMCNIVGPPNGFFELERLRDYLNAVTGWDTSVQELLRVGERTNNAQRVFNLREGLTAADDVLPDRMFRELKGGALRGLSLDREQWRQAIHDYYQTAGWDPDTGIPEDDTLVGMDLEWLVPEARRARESAAAASATTA